MTSKYMLDWHDNGTNNAAGKKAEDDVMYFLHRGEDGATSLRQPISMRKFYGVCL